jgi:hypothetical protein
MTCNPSERQKRQQRERRHDGESPHSLPLLVEERTRRPLLLSVVERRRPLDVAGVHFPP